MLLAVMGARYRARSLPSDAQSPGRAETDCVADPHLFVSRYLLGEHHDNALIVLIEDCVGGHHAHAGADADVAVCHNFTGHHLTFSDSAP